MVVFVAGEADSKKASILARKVSLTPGSINVGPET